MKHILLVALAAVALTANGQETFKARLRPVPVDAALARTIMGSGQATATLTGAKLTVTGTFEGLQSPATTLKIHSGGKMGVRGNAILDLAITKAAAGMLSGSVDLTPAQVEALHTGKLYLQIAAEKAPDGNLWGWFTK